MTKLSFKGRFLRRFPSICIARHNSLAPKISPLLPGSHPDQLDAHELRVRRSQPTLLDELTLAVDRPEPDRADAPPDEAEAAEADPLAPSHRTMLLWALEELSAARAALQASPPPDPAIGWDTFATSRLEWDPQAAVEVDQLYIVYARWCAAHTAPLLAEAEVLAWLTARGATLHTGPLSQVTTVQGVRVMV